MIEGAVGLDLLAARQDRRHAGVAPDDALHGGVEADRHVLRGILEQRAKAAPGLGVALQPFGRKPLLGRDRLVGRALHAFAHLDEGADDQLVDLGQPRRMQQRIDRLLDRDRARPPDAGHRLALPARPFDGRLEGHAPQHGAAALALARRRRRAVVDQQPVALRFDEADAELAAPQRERIAVDAMHPRAAEIERRAERIVGPGAAADALARLEHGDGEARIVQQARGDQARHAGADHDRRARPWPRPWTMSRSSQHQAGQLLHVVEQLAARRRQRHRGRRRARRHRRVRACRPSARPGRPARESSTTVQSKGCTFMSMRGMQEEIGKRLAARHLARR